MPTNNAKGLEEVLGLLGKATPGPWRECGHERGGCVCGLIFSEPADAAVAITAIHDDELPKPMPGVPQANMQAIAAAVNYLRSRGVAIRELVEADREYDVARTAYESAAWPEVPRQQKEQAGARMVAARNRRAAALRQVEGK